MSWTSASTISFTSSWNEIKTVKTAILNLNTRTFGVLAHNVTINTHVQITKNINQKHGSGRTIQESPAPPPHGIAYLWCDALARGCLIRKDLTLIVRKQSVKNKQTVSHGTIAQKNAAKLGAVKKKNIFSYISQHFCWLITSEGATTYRKTDPGNDQVVQVQWTGCAFKQDI